MKQVAGYGIVLSCLAVGMVGEAPVLSASAARHPTTVTVMRQRGASSLAGPLYAAIQDPREATLLYHDLTVLNPYPLRLKGKWAAASGLAH